MVETLYKTATPRESTLHGEYYTLSLGRAKDGPGFVLTEQHGFWDDSEEMPKNTNTTLSPDEGYATFDDGLPDYQRQKYSRARQGFVHCFSTDPMSPDTNYERYELIKLDEARP
jgi:hypothetical protein